MPGRRIVLIQGHPDPEPAHFGHALADAYARGAGAAGYDLRIVTVATLDFPLLRSKAAWDRDPAPPDLVAAQDAIAWANHLAIFFPLWLGTLPAVLKGFLEQALRPGLAFVRHNGATGWQPALKGKSARVVVTMGMPAPVYRWFYLAHGVRGFERNILRFCGIAPIRETLIGMIEAPGNGRHERWLRSVEELGCRGE